MKTITISLLFTVISVFTLKAQQPNEYPEPRIGATFIKADSIYILFGGKSTSKNTNACFLNSMSMFDCSTNHWEEFKPVYNDPNYLLPPGCVHHAAIFWHGKMYVIAGETVNGLTNQIWEYDVSSKCWSNVSLSFSFTPRKNVVATVVGNQLYICGGEDATGHVLKDAYVIHLSDFTGAQIANVPGGSPATVGAASVVLDSTLYMFGGYNDYGSTNSNIHYNANTQAWEMSFNTDFHTGFAGIASVSNEKMYLWGGSSTSKNVMENKLYSYNAITDEQTLISENIPAGEYFYCGILDIDSTSKSTPDTVLYMWGGDVNQSFYKYSFSQDTVMRYDTIQGDFTTSIEHSHLTNKNNFSVYPNPAQDYIVITSKTKQSVKNINILDVTGKLVSTSEKFETYQKIDISKLPKGVYFIKFNTAEGLYLKKFIKE